MGSFLPNLPLWGEAGAGEGAAGKAGATSPPEELAFHVPSGKTASAWIQQRRPAVVACFLFFFFPVYIWFLGNREAVREWEREEQDVDLSIHVSGALGIASGPG